MAYNEDIIILLSVTLFLSQSETLWIIFINFFSAFADLCLCMTVSFPPVFFSCLSTPYHLFTTMASLLFWTLKFHPSLLPPSSLLISPSFPPLLLTRKAAMAPPVINPARTSFQWFLCSVTLITPTSTARDSSTRHRVGFVRRVPLVRNTRVTYICKKCHVS